MVCIDSKQLKVHRVIASAFLTKTNTDDVVNHKNGIKTDNRVENLEWCTQKHNVQHAFKNGLMVRHKGSKNAASKLEENQVRVIKSAIKEGYTLTGIGKYFNVTVQCIALIKSGRNWGHIQSL